MKAEETNEKLESLISAWCERKELIPLRRILNGSAAINGLTDGWAELLSELQTIRAQDRGHLTEQELDIVIDLQQELSRYVSR